jgi:uroporphyrinogen decarboxylase
MGISQATKRSIQVSKKPIPTYSNATLAASAAQAKRLDAGAHWAITVHEPTPRCAMNHRERFVRTLTGKPVDRVPFIKLFGGTNAHQPRWEAEYPGIGKVIDQVLQFEGVYRGWDTTDVNFWMCGVGEPAIIEDNETRQVIKHPTGLVEVKQKGRDFHHQTVAWPVKSPQDWARIKERYFSADDPARFPKDWAEHVTKYRARDYPLQLTHGGVYGFARTHLMGDENLMYAFYDEPKMVHDMMDTYTDMILAIWSKLVKEVEFDLIECWEDMASKNGCLISPKTFREFMTPNYRRIAEFARQHKIEIVLVDSDGYTDDLAEVMQEAGVTALYPFEAGAGCHVAEARRRYPELGILGGLAKESMIYGKAEIDKEIEKARQIVRLGRVIPGPDHFVQSDVSWENYRYFMERLRQTVMTTPLDA